MSPRARLLITAALALLLLLAALAGLALWVAQAQQAQMQAQRDDHVLRNLRQLAENSLATGLQPEQLEMLQTLIEREHQAFSAILAIDVFSAQGLVLYSSDPGARGSTIPPDWRAVLAQETTWHSAAQGLRRVGQRFDNDLGQAAGGIVVTLGPEQERASLAQWAERAQQALAWLALALAALLTATLALHQGLARWHAPYAQAARTVRGQAPEGCADTPLQRSAAHAHAHTQHLLATCHQSLAQLEALDRAD